MADAKPGTYNEIVKVTYKIQFSDFSIGRGYHWTQALDFKQFPTGRSCNKNLGLY